MRFFFSGLFLLMGVACCAQRAPRVIQPQEYEPIMDSLKIELGEGKVFLPEFELQTLIALIHYPELKKTKIEFVYKKLGSTMAARPRLLTTIRRKGKRSYCIFLNNVNPEIPIDGASFNAQIGVIGHELGHISNYETKSSWRLIADALRYPSKKFRRKFERATDQRNLDHGLFWQLYDWKMYAFHHKHADPEYLEYKRKIYLSPEEVKAQE